MKIRKVIAWKIVAVFAFTLFFSFSSLSFAQTNIVHNVDIQATTDFAIKNANEIEFTLNMRRMPTNIPRLTFILRWGDGFSKSYTFHGTYSQLDGSGPYTLTHTIAVDDPFKTQVIEFDGLDMVTGDSYYHVVSSELKTGTANISVNLANVTPNVAPFNDSNHSDRCMALMAVNIQKLDPMPANGVYFIFSGDATSSILNLYGPDTSIVSGMTSADFPKTFNVSLKDLKCNTTYTYRVSEIIPEHPVSPYNDETSTVQPYQDIADFTDLQTFDTTNWGSVGPTQPTPTTPTSSGTLPPGQVKVILNGGGRTLVPECNTQVDASTGKFSNPCDFGYLMKLVQNIIDFLIFDISIPLAALLFSYAGFLLVTGASSEENRGKAKKIFLNVVIGLVIALVAWLAVKWILWGLGYDTTIYKPFYVAQVDTGGGGGQYNNI